MPSDLPLGDVFEPFAWVFVGLLALNVVLFAAVVIQREQWCRIDGCATGFRSGSPR